MFTPDVHPSFGNSFRELLEKVTLILPVVCDNKLLCGRKAVSTKSDETD